MNNVQREILVILSLSEESHLTSGRRLVLKIGENNMIIKKTIKNNIPILMAMMEKHPDAYSKDYIFSDKRGSIASFFERALNNDQDDCGSFVIEESGKIIGHLGYQKDARCFQGGVYELVALIIDDYFTGKGYAHKLTERVTRELGEIGARIVWLQTEGVDKEKIFERFGFKRQSVWPDYWGNGRERIVMIKYL